MEHNFKQYKPFFEILDQVFEIERKSDMISDNHSLARNINKIKDIFENNLISSLSGQDAGLLYHNPIGEVYNETRLDVEASIAGDSAENLVIIEVIKPIIRYKSGASSVIARKGVVVVETKK